MAGFFPVCVGLAQRACDVHSRTAGTPERGVGGLLAAIALNAAHRGDRADSNSTIHLSGAGTLCTTRSSRVSSSDLKPCRGRLGLGSRSPR